ncbi:MAG: L,D-transpeptidase family protein [Aggregatilineales bacterium]
MPLFRPNIRLGNMLYGRSPVDVNPVVPNNPMRNMHRYNPMRGVNSQVNRARNLTNSAQRMGGMNPNMPRGVQMPKMPSGQMKSANIRQSAKMPDVMRNIPQQRQGYVPQQASATMPNRAYAPNVNRRMPVMQGQMPPAGARISAPRRRNWLLWIALVIFGLVGMSSLLIGGGAAFIYSNGILPGVSAGNVNLSGMSQSEARAALENSWSEITLRDGQRLWQVERESLGIAIDTSATTEEAYWQGRGAGNPLNAIFGDVEITPFVTVDINTLTNALNAVIDDVNIAPVDAGVTLVNGVVEATPPQVGHLLDVEATVNQLQSMGASALASGTIDLVMIEVQPQIFDSSGIVQAASTLLANPLTLRVYDPATGDIVFWTAEPEEWANWISASSDPSSATGLALSLQETPLRVFLASEATVFDASRFIDVDEAVADVQTAIANNVTSTTLRVYHNDRQHVVQSGETITSIAWDYGVPYPYVQQANPGVDALTVGQTITIPTVDTFLPYPVVPEKRIVVSISEQRVRVYENGSVIQDWLASTGVSDSPTWAGVYQIISHEPNAYAGNWNLWMPYFMGVYQPIPGSEFTNGFHGYPTRGGGQILWVNNLGSRVTFGCIMLSDDNVAWLYDWAEEGVVVEIRA